MDSFGKRLAEHQLELNGGGPAEEEKPKEVKKVEKKKETKKVDNQGFDEDEMKAINKISMNDEKPKSFKEYQME
jgi:hypothetical protein